MVYKLKLNEEEPFSEFVGTVLLITDPKKNRFIKQKSDESYQ